MDEGQIAFALAGIGSALWGKRVDATRVAFVIRACSFLPLLSLAVSFPPELRNPDPNWIQFASPS